MDNVSLRSSVGGPPRYWIVGDPRELWPREGDFCRWLAATASLLAECIRVPGLEVTGREVMAGEQVAGFDVLGRRRWDGGVRPALIARDAHGGVIVIEAQLGVADHDHLGKLVAYVQAVQAGVAVWAVAAAEPPFLREHLVAMGATMSSNSGPESPPQAAFAVTWYSSVLCTVTSPVSGAASAHTHRSWHGAVAARRQGLHAAHVVGEHLHKVLIGAALRVVGGQHICSGVAAGVRVQAGRSGRSGPRRPSSASPPRTPPSNNEYGNSPPTAGPWTNGSRPPAPTCGSRTADSRTSKPRSPRPSAPRRPDGPAPAWQPLHVAAARHVGHT